ncbi:MAG: PQQ-like beta-propeller repeat protein, partial [Opitutales bacterium]|nr:PQQ-like beta-propeller repeat protein [Opitutales bacterium]
NQVLIFNALGVAAHSVKDGSTRWEYPWTRSTGTPRVSIPVRTFGNQFVVSSGYGAGADLFQVSKSEAVFQAEQKWRSLHLKAKFNNFVFRDGYIYGLDDGVLTCIDAETGRRTWKKGRYGHGQVILGDSWLLLMAENGEVILLDPNPDDAKILGSFDALEGKTWNPPAIAGPYLLVRNHLEAACYELPVSE